MREWHNRIQKIKLKKWIVTKFYHYTSIPQDIFGEYDTAWHSKPVGDPYLKELFDHFFEIAEAAYKRYKGEDRFGSLMDNKVTIEITNIDTGEKLYIGYKDWRYLIGKNVWSEFGYYTDFDKEGNLINYYKN